MKKILGLALSALSLGASAVTNVTGALEYLFAPMESRYGTTTNQIAARAVTCLDYLDGRIYVGGGDWDGNAGPVPIISIAPGDTPAWTNEYSAGTEQIESYKKFSDGRIWTRATDPREHDENYGHFFAKYPGGEWVRCPLGKVDWNPAHSLNSSLQLYMHGWDFCEYKTNFYFTGYGIGGSSHWLNGDDAFEHQMGSVTSGQTNIYYRYTYITQWNSAKDYTTAEGTNLERFMTLMPFDNGCIAVPYHWYESRKPELNTCYFWRRDAATGAFRREDCPWSTFLSGYAAVDRALAGSTYGWWLHFRKATPYKGRVYYIVSPGCSLNAPIGFFSAAMDSSGAIASKRHAFEEGKAHVIDLTVVGGSLYVMTVRRESATSIVHGIWKSTDGENFTPLATFTSDQYCISFTYAKGAFYVGYGRPQIGNVDFSACTATPATDKCGQIWRFPLLQADDDGSNDGRDLSGAPWYFDALNVTKMQRRGITGKGVKVGVVDVGAQPIVEGDVTHLAIDHHAGATGKTLVHGIGVSSIVKSDRFGIAPDCELYAYNGSGFRDDINGLWWCLTNGCRVVNFSGGYTPFQYTADDLAWGREQIREMLSRGAILVVAGGNAPNETLTFPQDMEGVINVAGLKRDGTSANLNDNWAKDFAAFGDDVPLYTSATGATGTNSGTSFAAPMVTGVIALYLQQKPDLTRDEIYRILKSRCRVLSEERSRIWGWGLVQADTIPSDYVRAAAIEAERAAWVKATKLTLGNRGLDWNETSGWYEIKMYPGESRTLKSTVAPADASDTNAYWYCGNTESFNRIGLDNVLTVPATTATGSFLVYTCRNVERETIGQLKVTVVEKGQESGAEGDGTGDDAAAFRPTNSWFTVDCALAVFAPSTNYQPTVAGYAASNAYVEVSTTMSVTTEEPVPGADEKASLYLAGDETKGTLGFRVWTKSGWRDVANAALTPGTGRVYRVRMDLEKGTAEARRIRYSVDGQVLSANGTEWFEMTSGGDVTEILFIGEAEVSAFFGEFCDGFGAAAPTLEELLDGKAPTIAGYLADGRSVPAFQLSEGKLAVSLAETASGVYYTAFTSETLVRADFKAVRSVCATGAPITFEIDTEGAASQFLVVVASTAPIAAGTALE